MRFSIAVFLCAFVFAFPALAETKIAVLDVDMIMQESKTAKALAKVRNSARETLLSELSSKEKDLRAEGKSLYDSRKSLSEDEFVKKSKAYEEELLEMRRLTQTHKRKFEEASAESLMSMRDLVTATAQDVAKDEGYDLVISKRYVVVGENSLDITQETLKRLNKKNPKISFKVKK